MVPETNSGPSPELHLLYKIEWCPQGPSLGPPKINANHTGFLIQIENDHFSCDHAPLHAQLFAIWSLQKTYVFLINWALLPPGAAQCDQHLASNAHFWQHVLPFRPLPCSLGAVGRPSGLSNGLRCQFSVPKSSFWHLQRALHTSCCPKLGQHLVVNARS